VSDEWLDQSEVLVLDPLEDSPLPLWELRWPGKSSRERASVLTHGPAPRRRPCRRRTSPRPAADFC